VASSLLGLNIYSILLRALVMQVAVDMLSKEIVLCGVCEVAENAGKMIVKYYT